jgi:3-dehydroquinate synthase
MPESFEVKTSSGVYKVLIGEGLCQGLEPQSQAIFLVDEYLQQQLPFPSEKMIAIPALESSKNLDYMSGVIEQMRTLGANRDTHIYVIGGGIIQDIATFVNSIYMRGLSWTYFPSTLLSMADSCIGGKSSINVRGYKNLVGNIYPPSAVFVDMDFCKTLGANEIIGGLVEAVKICYAHSPEAFEACLSVNPHFPLAADDGVKVISSALLAKKWFIEIDEFDRCERLLLNYGHTFGHALEASSNFAIAHGVAVALGMLAANYYANLVGGLTSAGKARIARLDAYLVSLLAPIEKDLKLVLAKTNFQVVLSKFEGDKKHRQNHYRMVIPQAEGNLVLTTTPKSEEVKTLLARSYREAFMACGYLSL